MPPYLYVLRQKAIKHRFFDDMIPQKEHKSKNKTCPVFSFFQSSVFLIRQMHLLQRQVQVETTSL